MKYAVIVTLNFEGAEELFQIIDNEGEENALEYLKQWDYSEGVEEECETVPWGTHDTLYKKDNYIMYYNRALDYVELIEVLTA